MEKCRNKILNSDTTMEIDVPNIKRNYQLSFYGRISEMGTITIGHGFVKPWASAYVEIDSAKIRVYAYFQEKELQQVYTHKLEIVDFISVMIKVKEDATADLFVTTSSGSYTQNIVWNGSFGPVKASIASGNLTDCQLRFYSEDYSKPIWAFGDSYFGAWPKYLNNKGENNCLWDAFPGRQSLHALESLKKSLRYGTPQIVLWCMGMNDKDTDTEINPNWLKAVKNLIQICEQHKIELILTTTPNVPIINHSFKNEYVRTSGYRYVDINQAVGADIDKKWYAGLLAKDNVHPTPMGAEVIAARMLADVPQLLKYGVI